MKEAIRHFLAALMRRLLAAQSRPLPLGPGPVLIIAPHADDETLGCGGLIAAQRARGVSVQVVFITDSAASDWSDGATRAERAATRQTEAIEALACLGVSPAAVRFLDAPDGELGRLDLATHRRVLGAMADTIRELQPRDIFLPYLGDGSTEHDAAVWLTQEALQLAGQRAALWEYPVWAWWNALRLHRQLLRRGENFRHDARAWIGLRRRALACHASQTGRTAPLPPILAGLAGEPVEYFFHRTTSTP